MNQTYIVKAGDTLYGISNQFGVSVTELAELNNIYGDNLQIGQELIIPAKSGMNPDNMFMYTVKKGDSLYSIAKIYNTSVDKIKSLNYLKNDNLYIGQVIRIPENYTPSDDLYIPQFVNYTVKAGDTLYSIARQFNVSIDTIIQDNAMKDNVLTVGSNLKIRSDNGMVIEECFGEDYIVNDNTYDYIVKAGDSLYSIARANNTTVSELINLNNLSSNLLSVGQVLKIPGGNYVVKAGDTLYSIAKMFNISVDELKRKNNLINNNLSIGQVLNV